MRGGHKKKSLTMCSIYTSEPTKLTEGERSHDSKIFSLLWCVWGNGNGLDGCSGLVIISTYSIIVHELRLFFFLSC